MQQAPPDSAFQGNEVAASGSLQSRSGGDPPQITAWAPATRPKKRERNEAGCGVVKHPRIEKNQCCGNERDENQKPEAPSLVGRDGGLCSVSSVDRLVCIMTYEWNDSMQRPMDLTVSRAMLAKVIAATVELDCLVRFLELGGLSVLDRWLQEVNMGRPSEKKGSVEGDGMVVDLLLALLGALERLPVDLVALKTCSIGKSVNHLRSHKHPDIQRRARKLVETWKRRLESGDTRRMEQNVCPQKSNVGMGTSNFQQDSHPEHKACNASSGIGIGKFASVASLCSSPEIQNKASSKIIPQSCSADTSKRSLSSIKPLSESFRSAVESTLHTSNDFPQSSEEGRAPTSSAFVPEPCNNQTRSVRNTGSNRCSRNTNLSISNTSSALSGPVFVPKDHAKQGFVLNRSTQGSNASSAIKDCTVPCCSFVQNSSDIAMVHDPPSRSILNSASCVIDCKEKAIQQPIMCNQPLIFPDDKASIQALTSVSACESSTVDVKCADSPSDKGMRLLQEIKLTTERRIPAENITKTHNYQPSKVSSSLQGREHYDRNSSTLSSPSDTWTHRSTSIRENERAPAVYENTPSPADTGSETSLPSALGSQDMGMKRGACSSSTRKEHEKVQSLCVKIKRTSSLVAEAVGESSIMDKEDCENRVSSIQGSTSNNTAGTNAAMERSLSSRGNEDAALEAARIDALKVEHEAENCKQISSRELSFERSTSCGDVVIASGSADACTLQGSKEDSPRTASQLQNASFSAINSNARNSPLVVHAGSAGADVHTVDQEQGAEVPASTRRENKRLDFDLNEMLSGGGEEVLVQSSGLTSKLQGPLQGFSLPTSDAVSALPTVPMAPVAVVTAMKGPFMLQAISSCRMPTGELGWKGSAATSAFRPTQPRGNLPKSNIAPDQSTHGKTVLDFDLNIAAESPVSDDKIRNADIGVKSSTSDVKVAALQVARGAITSLGNLSQVCEPARASWDLNQVEEGVAGSGTNKLDFDLNNGPNVQDHDDVVLAAKHIRLRNSLPSTNSATLNKLPIHPVTPILMPAFAMPNCDVPHATGSAMPWMNGGPHDGRLQYNIFMQNPSGFASSAMTCPPQPSMGAGPFQGIPFRFSSAPVQHFSAPLVDTHGASQSAVFSPLPSSEILAPSQSKPSHIMGMLADVIHQHGMGGFWNGPSFDLNAGPEGVNGSNAKDDRRYIFIMNEQMKGRHQVGDNATVLQQREQDGCVGMPGSMPGVLASCIPKHA